MGAVRARAVPVFSPCGRVRDFTFRAEIPFPEEEGLIMEVRPPPKVLLPLLEEYPLPSYLSASCVSTLGQSSLLDARILERRAKVNQLSFSSQGLG